MQIHRLKSWLICCSFSTSAFTRNVGSCMRLSLKRSLGVAVLVSDIAAGRWKIPLAALLLFAPGSASGETFVSRYALSLGGFRIGDATLHTDLNANHYKVQVSA